MVKTIVMQDGSPWPFGAILASHDFIPNFLLLASFGEGRTPNAGSRVVIQKICPFKREEAGSIYHDVCLLALTWETVLKSIGLQLPGRRVGSLIKTSEQPAESEENASEHATRRL